jgi:hypothetical protein
MNTVPPWRQIVQEQLELIASESEQREYEAKVPHVDITKELVSGWSDDSYHAGDAEFVRSFTESELTQLAEFNKKFCASLATLPLSKGTVETWLASPVWRTVMEDAARTRRHIEG